MVLSLAWCAAVCAHPRIAMPSIAAASQPTHTQRDQDAQALADYVTQFLQTHTHTANGDALHVQVEHPHTKGLASCDRLQAVSPKRLQSRTSVQVRCLAPQTWNLFVQTHLTWPGVYYTAARTMAPGDVVTPDDLHATHTDLLRLPQDAIIDPAQAIGHLATQRIRKGSAIKSGALRSPTSIQRKQRVHVETRASCAARGRPCKAVRPVAKSRCAPLPGLWSVGS